MKTLYLKHECIQLKFQALALTFQFIRQLSFQSATEKQNHIKFITEELNIDFK